MARNASIKTSTSSTWLRIWETSQYFWTVKWKTRMYESWFQVRKRIYWWLIPVMRGKKVIIVLIRKSGSFHMSTETTKMVEASTNSIRIRSTWVLRIIYWWRISSSCGIIRLMTLLGDRWGWRMLMLVSIRCWSCRILCWTPNRCCRRHWRLKRQRRRDSIMSIERKCMNILKFLEAAMWKTQRKHQDGSHHWEVKR